MADLKVRIAKRCAKEFKDGEFANLGIGLPTMVADYIPEDITVTFHSENGFAGIDAVADASNLDVDIINSGGTLCNRCSKSKVFRYSGVLRSCQRRTRQSYRSRRDGSCRKRRPCELDRTGQESCRYGRCYGPLRRLPGSYHYHAAHPEG